MSIERPHPGRFGAQSVVFVHVVTPRAEMQAAIHSALTEISAALQVQDVAPSGPWFAHHHKVPTDTFDFDVCFPVKQEVTISGQLQMGAIPETEVVRTAFHGSYDGLPAAWSEFTSWIRTKGYKTREDSFEVYSIGPRETKEPGGWQTDLIAPLVESLGGKEQLV